jgi:alkane 1-monooxygenase
LKAFRFAIPFLFLATAPLGWWLGGAWTFLTLAVLPLVLSGFDAALGFDGDARGAADAVVYRVLPWAYVAAQIAVILWAGNMVARTATGLVEAVGLTVSVGLTAGVFGMAAAHELVHRPSRAIRAGGLSFLAVVGYMHFRIAHIHGHHVRAATFEDPTSARRGEGVYRFIVRAIVGQVAEAWAFEAVRLRRRGERVIGPGNRMLVYAAIEIVVAAGFALMGPRAFAFWIAQAALAVAMLELFNYIAHYGLVRATLPGGRTQRLAVRHSWNSTRRMNNSALFNMGRHSDHHRHPARAYQGLEAMEGAPELPAGYAGAILMALVPPLWRQVMDPRVDAWMGPLAEAAE